MREFDTIAEMANHVGEELGTSDWMVVTQSMIDMFADATGDHQWIHVDPERAAKGPFGATIAHGFLTLSLLPKLAGDAVRIKNQKMGVNYGLNRVRFTAPVRAGSRVRGRATLVGFEPLPNNGAQVTTSVVIELEGSDKPACVAEAIARRYA
ncbi:MAG: MaoC family dehydratase [Burkholderiaceae bacterium]|jgi:acyl dehydratase|nr:MaoC family dehydratase [Burkholderiaceae bacterium]MEB2318903.1 MaoC family dehydratase [Pseudomonadota bacterium]